MSFYNDPISVTYHHGSKILLTSEWHDRNIICPNSKFYYVLNGELCVQTETEKLIAMAGDAILIPAGIKHSYYLTKLGFAEKYWFHFDLRIAQGNYFDFLKIPKIKHIGRDSALDGLFEGIIAADSHNPRERLRASSALLDLVSLYIGDAEYISVENEKPDETDRVINYIKKNYHESFTLSGLSDIANLSPNYLEKKFKERTGLPPLKYINALRLERAKFLLEHSQKSVAEIMEEVGFWDASHFSKLFKSETGYSPTKFRKAISGRQE